MLLLPAETWAKVGGEGWNRNRFRRRSRPDRLILGRYNPYFIDLYRNAFGEAFQPGDAPAAAHANQDPVRRLFRGVDYSTHGVHK